ncbi:MAG: DUF547 domain-containing protein [Deltaproteobacteria bacterium]|nr:DUF547 domain-containing protein [Deltaproteobacteria bacterium]
MILPRPATTRVWAVSSLAGLLVASTACGEYVAYENGPPANVPPGAVNLDEATKAWLESTKTLEHVAWTGLLTRYAKLDSNGVVLLDYRAISTSTEATLQLDRYLATLDVVESAQLEGTAERLGYWINGYNAAVVRGVLDFWSGDSTYSVSSNDFVFFDLPRHRFGGLVLSLNQIEHGVLRGDTTHASVRGTSDDLRARLLALHQEVWQGQPIDARFHIALNCASLSCPNLLFEAFRGPALETQLDSASRAFVADPEKGAGPNGISSIFRFYAADFEVTYGNAAGFISRHREGGLDGVNLDRYLEYDWSLNAPP